MTDNELIIKVAEAKGWTNIQRVEGYLMGSPARRPHARTNLPAYLTDANEWVKLLEEMKADVCKIVFTRAADQHEVVFSIDGHYHGVCDPSLAHAVLHAYLAYKQRQTKEQDAHAD